MPHGRPAALVAACLLASCGGKSKSTEPITLQLKQGCNPFAVTSECLYPFPSSFFQQTDSTSSTGVRVNYPAGIFGGSTGPGSVAIDVGSYNTADGAPPASPLLLYFGADVDVSNLPGPYHEADSMLPGAPIAILDLVDGTRVPYFVEMDANTNSAYPNRAAFIIRPMSPMEMGHRHAVVIMDSVQLAGGTPLPAPPAFTALRDGTITTNTEIEQVRPTYESIFTMAEANGYSRQHIALAWDFMVASQSYVLGPILSMRTTALQQLGTTGLGYTIATVAPTAEGGELVEGTFEVPTFVNANNVFDWDSNHLPTEQTTNNSYEFTMYIPSISLASDAQPIPLGIFGHGLFGTGRAYLDTDSSISPTIHQMAERSHVVLIATDWIGLSGSNDDLAVGEMVATNLNNIEMVTDRLTQSLINNIAMTKLARGNLQQDPQVKPTGHALIDTTKTYYYGVSLGGIQGASLVSISDDISAGVLAVPGCDWSTMFPRSTDWSAFQSIAETIYPDPLQQITLLSLAQTFWDFTDSVNLGLMLQRQPIQGNPTKTVLMQESIGDSQVTNIVTGVLARVLGVGQLTPDYMDLYGLAPTTSPTTSSVLAQYYMTYDVANDMPPLTDTVPPNDDGAHFGLNLLPNVQDQIVNFVTTGQIKQYCENVCTPF